MFLQGFADELVKTAGVGSAAKRLAERLRSSPELRKAIARSAALGAGTGALQTMVQPKDERKLLRNMAAGALAGGATGVAFPGWFGRSSMRAADEL